jgi:plastocyanin
MSTDAPAMTETDTSLHARWSRFAALGLFMVGLAAFLLVGAVLIWGLDAEGQLPFFIALIAVPWVGAYLVDRYGTWSKIVAIVIALLAVGMMFWTAFGLGLPGSFFDFVPGVLVVPGAVVAIVGAVAAMVAKRRGHVSARPDGGERRAIQIVVAVVVALAAISAVMSVAGRQTVDATDASATVDFKNFEFDSAGYEAPGGSQIVVTNDDPFTHTFTIDALGIDVTLGPNDQALVDLPATTGTFIVYCKLHTSDPDHPTPDDMASTFTIAGS